MPLKAVSICAVSAELFAPLYLAYWTRIDAALNHYHSTLHNVTFKVWTMSPIPGFERSKWLEDSFSGLTERTIVHFTKFNMKAEDNI